jgi:hypothetical protein
MHGLGLNVDDCQATFEELSAKGVEFIQHNGLRWMGTEFCVSPLTDSRSMS